MTPLEALSHPATHAGDAVWLPVALFAVLVCFIAPLVTIAADRMLSRRRKP